MADDGSATLDIPEGALPAGTDPATITLTALDPADAPATVEGFEVTVAYELGPDGLQLSAPATLRHAILESEESTLYLALHVSEDDLELLPIAWEMPGETDESSKISASLAHFSKYVLFKGDGAGRIEYEVAANDTIVGAVTAAGVVRAELIADTIIAESKVGRVRAMTISITSSRYRPFLVSASSNLSPRSISDKKEGTFECLSSGPMVFAFKGWMFVSGQTYVDGKPGDELVDSDFLLHAAGKDVGVVTRTCADSLSEATDDYIDSVKSALVTYLSSIADIIGFGAVRGMFTQAAADALFNDSILECGETTATGALTVCPEGVVDFPAGDYYLVSTTVADALPKAGADDGHHFIYAAVFDSDGAPSNDWQFVEPYDWDYFQGADRWYQLLWDPSSASWSLTVSQVDASQNVATASSSVRATVHGETITWFIPAAELPAAQPTFRVTAFGHDGNYSPDDRGGDVSGADPTEPLIPLPVKP